MQPKDSVHPTQYASLAGITGYLHPQPEQALLCQLGTGHKVIGREVGRETRELGSNPALLTSLGIAEQVTETHLSWPIK